MTERQEEVRAELVRIMASTIGSIAEAPTGAATAHVAFDAVDNILESLDYFALRDRIDLERNRADEAERKLTETRGELAGALETIQWANMTQVTNMAKVDAAESEVERLRGVWADAKGAWSDDHSTDTYIAQVEKALYDLLDEIVGAAPTALAPKPKEPRPDYTCSHWFHDSTGMGFCPRCGKAWKRRHVPHALIAAIDRVLEGTE